MIRNSPEVRRRSRVFDLTILVTIEHATTRFRFRVETDDGIWSRHCAAGGCGRTERMTPVE